MPRQRLPVQYFADMLDQLKSMNAKLDTLIGQSAPQAAPAEPTVEPAPVRLEEPVRPSVDSSFGKLMDAAVEAAEGIDVENDAQMSPLDQHGTCQEKTKRGNTCGKPLPCRYHG